MNLTISARIVIGFATALAVLLILATTSYSHFGQLREESRRVLHTMDVLQQKERVVGHLFEAQSVLRGHLMVGDDQVSERLGTAVVNLRAAMRELRQLTSDNPEQQRRIDQLEPLIDERIEVLQGLLASATVARNAVDEAAEASIRRGIELAKLVTMITQEIEAHERDLLDQRQRSSQRTGQIMNATLLYGTLAAFLFVALVAAFLTRNIRDQLRGLAAAANRIAHGDYASRVPVRSADELGELATSFNAMAQQIQERQRANEEEQWLQSNLTRLSALFEAERRLDVLGQRLLTELCGLTNAQHAVLYVRENEEPALQLAAAYAADAPPRTVRLGDGLIGEACREGRRVLTDIPEHYVRISSALGRTSPRSLLIVPCSSAGSVRCVFELASLSAFSELHLRFIDQLAERFALVLTTIQAGERTHALLARAQALTAELQAQSDKLRESEGLLREQQEELRQTNEELEQANEELQHANQEMEERANLLAQQKISLEQSNRQVEESRQALERQSAQLAQTSKYKSEFLANMSHELRTPLNSLLILSQTLAENVEGNLTPKQVQHARTINASGHDLLALINDILDLSKIEAGAVELDIAETPLASLVEFIEHTFRPVAEQKRLQLDVRLDPSAGTTICTDLRRLQQIVKNLLSNALKFTSKGSVELTIRAAQHEWRGKSELLDGAATVLAFEVRDTGIGIPPERLQLIFEAFQQGEAGTARKYGGTGLGLSISRELAQRLGGVLQVESEVGKGSVFTLYLPREATAAQLAYAAGRMTQPAVEVSAPALLETRSLPSLEVEASAVKDDRDALQPGDFTLLAIEDDVSFAQVLADFARARGFKVILAQTAGSGLALARKLRPTAITLDLRLPDADGRMVLDLLKHDPSTRHIPIHVISIDEARERMLRAGAVSFLQKPVSKEALESALAKTVEFVQRPMKNLLIIEDDDVQRRALVDLIGEGDVSTTAVSTAQAAREAIAQTAFDCIVLDLILPDQSGIDLIQDLHAQLGTAMPPVIVYTAKALTRAEETELRRLSEAIILKDARSPERLLDETALFLHRVQEQLPEPKRKLLEKVQRDDPVLSDRKVLIVDDDVRNIFAITSALESYRMNVIYAESGRSALELLATQPDIEAVLMDVMMPEMDGFEATQRIRRMEGCKDLPIIMVTAKAMKGDRERCLAAGASDYITKPVDMDQLRSLLRVWLYR